MGIGGTFGLFKSAFFKPEEVFDKEAARSKAGWMDGLKNNAIAFLVIPILALVLTFAAGTGGLGSGIVFAVALYIAFLVGAAAVAYLFNLAANLMGGKGTAEKSAHVLSVLNGTAIGTYVVIFAVYLAMVEVSLASPLASLMALPVGLIVMYALGAYLTYVIAVAVRSVHGIGTLKSVFAFSIAVGIVLFAALLLLFALGFGSALMPSSGAAY